jgi:pyruvate/2-oxoglutarate/acetoin dehydrogenase E1 component
MMPYLGFPKSRVAREPLKKSRSDGAATGMAPQWGWRPPFRI